MLLNTPSKIVFTKPTIGKVLNYCISHSETLMIMQTTQILVDTDTVLTIHRTQ